MQSRSAEALLLDVFDLQERDRIVSFLTAPLYLFDEEDTLGQFLADETSTNPHAFTAAEDLAVRFNWSSRLGGLLDPTADKLLITGMFITLAWAGHIPVWLAAVVIFRDVVIVAGAMAYNYLVKPVPGEPTRISKLNTALQMLFVLFVLSRAGFDWPDKITITILGASILVTVVISDVDYVWSWSRRAKAGE